MTGEVEAAYEFPRPTGELSEQALAELLAEARERGLPTPTVVRVGTPAAHIVARRILHTTDAALRGLMRVEVEPGLGDGWEVA